MSNKLLTVVTRAYARPNALKRCCQSVGSTKYPHLIEQKLLVDTEGVGIAETHRRLREVEIDGRWGFILDDDDYLIDTDRLIELVLEAEVTGCDLVVVRMKHGERVLPPLGETTLPSTGYIGISAVVCRNDLFDIAKRKFGVSYEGDYGYVSEAYGQAEKILFSDDVVSVSRESSYGRPEFFE